MNALQRTFGFIHRHPLAKRHLLRSYSNFIIWQMKSRLFPGFHKIKFMDQTYFLIKKGLTGLSGNIYTGLHDFNDMGFLLHFLRPEDIFYDVGANVGSYTLLASSICKAKSVSFEPVPTTFKMLEDNVCLNDIGHLNTLENKCVGEKEGVVNFSINDDTTNHVIAEGEISSSAISVNVVSLDDYLINKLAPILIKIDVEGFETEVINGAKILLTNPMLKAIIIELIGGGEHYGNSEANIHKILLEHSFKPFSYNPIDRTLQEITTFGDFNTIYLRALDFVKKRLKTAPPFKVFNETI